MTGSSYQEVSVPEISESKSVVVAVKACRDAHLALSSSLDLTVNVTEIVIGAGSNSYQAIRGCLKNCNLG